MASANGAEMRRSVRYHAVLDSQPSGDKFDGVREVPEVAQMFDADEVQTRHALGECSLERVTALQTNSNHFGPGLKLNAKYVQPISEEYQT
ncbi:hypothetical protein [Verminephrobacter eiseniae]|uniref:hypothetical protein n=1 Tax=Verminephrobacter eiseniae TaxID=364317 RepID=UPI0022375550|nr:hypothetical protein [Verminephrobacter eiseniae]